MKNSSASRVFSVYKRHYLKFDLTAAIVVFLVAIPLCLGIALASGTPLFSGILSGIIGGIVIGTISASGVSVSGPAAGLVTIVIGAIAALGSFHLFLLALFLAGIFQIVIGMLKAGFIANYFPSNIIQGLLCAIGILLIFKQIPLAFTLSGSGPELKLNLMESVEVLHFGPFLKSLGSYLNPGAIFISLTALATLIYFDNTKNKLLKNIPGPIVVVLVSIILNHFFLHLGSSLIQDAEELVNIPEISNLKGFLSQLNYPDWNGLSNPLVYFYALVIAVVASLETLLNLKGGEKLDAKHRHSSSNQELVAQGVGNLILGLIGGIPTTSVIVRTSVNIQAGAKTKFATILHGFLILLAVLFLPELLNKIPLASLAAILIYTGYKLNKPSIYQNIYAQGWDRFIPFIVTVISIVALDLLTGILIGLVVSLFYILKSNSQIRINIIKEIYPKGIINRLILPQQMTFLNKAPLIAELDQIPKYSQLIIDARYTQYVDKEILEFLNEYREEQAPAKHISLNLTGFKEDYKIHNYVDFINVTTYDVQSKLLPAQVLNILHEGNQRFLHDTPIHRSNASDIQFTAATQHPIAVVLACIDSRVPVETIFDVSLGDIFCIRIAGNVVNDDILASIEYACSVVGAKLLMVLGHTRCGAIQAACDGVKKGHITQLLQKISPALQAEKQTTKNRDSKNIRFVAHVTELNIANTLQQVYRQSHILKEMIDQNDISLVGAIYDVTTGVVKYDDFADDLLLLDEHNKHLAQKCTDLLQQLNFRRNG